MNLIKESSLVKYGMKPLIHLDDLLRNGGGLNFQETFLPNAVFFHGDETIQKRGTFSKNAQISCSFLQPKKKSGDGKVQIFWGMSPFLPATPGGSTMDPGFRAIIMHLQNRDNLGDLMEITIFLQKTEAMFLKISKDKLDEK